MALELTAAVTDDGTRLSQQHALREGGGIPPRSEDLEAFNG